MTHIRNRRIKSLTEAFEKQMEEEGSEFIHNYTQEV